MARRHRTPSKAKPQKPTGTVPSADAKAAAKEPLSMHVIERIKLQANALDRASTGCFTIGVATPLAGAVYNIGNFRAAIGDATLLTGMAAWLFACIVLHWLARLILRGLR